MKISRSDCVVHPCAYMYSDVAKPYLFVDFDGTLRKTVDNTNGNKTGTGYGSDYKQVPPNCPEEVEVFEYVKGKLQLWYKSGWRVVGVTNQSGVNFGYMSIEECREVIKETIKQTGVFFPTFFAPLKNGPEGITRLRKPNTGMIQYCEELFGIIDRENSYVVGDWKSDFELAKAACLGLFKVNPKKEGSDFPFPPGV